MARVKDIEVNEASEEIRSIYEKFIDTYGPFANQAKVFAHRPIIFKHMMSMLMELADKPIIDKRYLEIAIVSVSAVNKCDYCVAHHAPNLISEGLSDITIDNILEEDCPGLQPLDILVRDYSVQITKDHNKVQDKQFKELREYLSNLTQEERIEFLDIMKQSEDDEIKSFMSKNEMKKLGLNRKTVLNMIKKCS